jgi:uncharacterized protein YfbU (UPF0304 family)
MFTKKNLNQILLIVLFLIPSMTTALLSKEYIKTLSSTNEIVFTEKSSDQPVKIETGTLDVALRLNGQIEAYGEYVIRCADCSDGDVVIEIGEEVSTGELIFVSKNKELRSLRQGVVKKLIYNGMYLTVIIHTNDQFRLAGLIDKKDANKFSKDLIGIASGVSYLLEFQELSFAVNELNQVSAYFLIDDLRFFHNERIEFIVFTGEKIENVQIINNQCVFKDPYDDRFLVRFLTEEGNIVGTHEISISGEGQSAVGVYGELPSLFCDMEYGKLMNLLNGNTP